MGPEDVQIVEAGSGAKVRLLISIDGENAALLRELANKRDKDIDEVVADLVRDAA